MPNRRALVCGSLLAAALTACSAAPGPEAAPSTRRARSSTSASTTSASTTSASTTSASTSSPPSFTLVATGDVLLHQELELTSGARRPDGSYDFAPVMAPVASIIRAADLAICHFETPVAPAGGPYRGYPSFAVQPQIVAALKVTGFDECSTASNHSLDDGLGGVVRTLDALDAAGIGHAGTYRTRADSTRPQILDVDGVKVAHIAAAYGLNGGPPPPGHAFAVDLDPVPDVTGLLAAARRARAAGAQVVVASLHCCVEYQHDPTPAQVRAVHTLLASPDIDLVIGHHAHVVQPFERIGGKWAAYGLGNFVAEMARRGDPYDEVVARFTFTRGADGRFTVSKAEAIPLHVDVGPTAVRVVPADPASFARTSAVLGRRGAVAAGLRVVAG